MFGKIKKEFWESLGTEIEFAGVGDDLKASFNGEVKVIGKIGAKCACGKTKDKFGLCDGSHNAMDNK